MSLRVFGLTYFISTISIRCELGQAGQASGQWSVRRKTTARKLERDKRAGMEFDIHGKE